MELEKEVEFDETLELDEEFEAEESTSEDEDLEDEEQSTEEESDEDESESESENESEESEEADEGEESEGELVVTIGDEKPEEESKPAPKWVKDLRKERRDLKKRIKELESKQQVDEKTAISLPKKPKLEDYDYDAEKFEQELDNWHSKKIEFDKQEADKKAEQDKQAEEWQNTLGSYQEKKDALKVQDFDEAEEFIQETLNTTQQGVLVQGADNSALVVYALGKNPKKAKELASIKDPVKFAFAVAKLEAQLKTSKRTVSTKPEKTVKGTGKSSGSVDSTLERLREEASKTGNFSKLAAYKRKQRNKK